jgi:nucleoside-diphosphate-sugar epimerase
VVDVRDVASITLSLLQLSSFPQGNPRYPVSSGRAIHPQAIADILRSEIPDARDRIKEGTPGEGYKERYEVDAEKMMRVDSSKAKELLGREWIAFEKTVVDTALSFGGLV